MARTEVTGSQIKDGSVSLTADVTGILPVGNGGTGANTLPLNNILVGNGTGALQSVAPGTSGNVLTSNGSAWVSAPAVNEVTLTGSQTLSNKTLSAPVLSGTVTGTYTLGGTPTFPATVVQTTSTQTLTNKTISGASNTLSNIPQSAVIGLVTGLSKGSNVATNPGFEDTSLFLGQATYSTEFVRSGTRSAKIVGTGSGQWAYLSTTNTTVVRQAVAPGDVIYMECWIYGSTSNTLTSSAFYLYAQGYDGAGTNVENLAAGFVSASPALNGVWTKISGYRKMTDANIRTVSLGVYTTAAAGEVYYLDDPVVRFVTDAAEINQVLFGTNNPGTTILQSALPSNVVTTTGSQALTNKDLTGAGNTFPTFNQSTTGNAATATKLATARTINGVSFDGTANITVADATKEPTITAGTTAQYWRGDKSWQTLDKTAVGLGNVDNTSDATKNAATATLTNKTLTSPKINGIADQTNGRFALSFSTDAASVNYLVARGRNTGVAPTLSSFGTDTDVGLNLTTQGAGVVQANGVEVATTSGTQTLSNKTLTTPRVGTSILDANGVTILALAPGTSATNYLSLANSNNTWVGFTAMGAGTNIPIYLFPKGTAQAVIYTSTGVTPTLRADGADTNLNLNLTSKGTGVVQANGNQVETTNNKGVANGYASLDTNGKVPGSQLPNSIMTYEGLHDVSANSPALTDAGGNAGQVYRVSVAGSRNYGSGSITLAVGDYLIHNGTVWEKADTTDAVASVNGYTGNVSLTKSDVGLGSVDNTSDANKPVSTATQTALNAKEPTITAGTTAQYWRGDKSWQTLDKTAVGLGGVDNTSDATKNVLSATKWTTARTVQTNLASTASASVDGTANVTPGVTGTLAVGNGGTGATTLTGLVKGNGTSAMTAAVAGTDYAAPNQTMYIGTTAVAINRASAALTLAGITLTTPTISSIVNTGTLTLPTATDTLVGRATADTLTNKDLSSTTNIFGASVGRLVCTTAVGGTTAENGANTWAKIATFTTGTNQYAEGQFLLGFVNGNSGHHDTALVSVFIRTNSTNTNPSPDVRIMAKTGSGASFVNDSFKVIAGAWASDMELWVKKAASYGLIGVYEVARSSTSATTVTYNTGAAWQSAVPTGAVVNVSTDGVYSGLKFTSASTVQGSQLISTIATGTAPLTVTSTTRVANLNADLLDDMSATSANTASTVVARDASGNFSAGTITATLSGNATTATTLQTARTIGGVSFNGSANIDLPGVNTTGNQNTTGSAATLTTARTIALSGAVTGTATSFNGSANITIPTTVSATQGGVIYGSSATAYAATAAGTAGQLLVSGGTGAPTWVANDLTAFPSSAFKKSVRVATTANITLSGTQTIDGVAVVAGDRVLVKDQTTAAQNGIYAVAAGAWARTPDADVSGDIAAAFVNVEDGTVNGGQSFTNVFRGTDTIGTTAMPWYRNYSTLDATTTNTADKLVLRTANGDIFCRYGETSYVSMSHSAAARNTDTVFYSSTDNYIRKNTAAGFKTALALNNVDNTSDATKNAATATLTNKTIELPGPASLYSTDSSLTNATLFPDITAGRFPVFSPVAKFLWHNLLAFNRWWGTPTYETFDGTTWSSATLDSSLFDGKEASGVNLVNGTTGTGVRWTWNSSNIFASYVRWWVIGLTYVGATTPINSYLIESSADGVTWTTRHTSTFTGQASPLWLSSTNMGSDNRVRLTITTTNAQPIGISTIKALSPRWGNQGGGSELEFPYEWDSARRITIANGGAVARADGALNIGAAAATTAADGIFFGNDTNLYRSAANTLKTDDAFLSASTVTGTQLVSTVATGTAPLAVTSTTPVTNLTANYVTAGMPLNTDTYMNMRVIRNANTTASNDGMYVGYGNTNSGTTKLYGGLNSTTNPVVVSEGTLTLPGAIYSTRSTASGLATFNVAKTVQGNIHVQNGTGADNTTNNQAAITFNGGNTTDAQAGIYVLNNNTDGTRMGFATTNSYATGPQLFMTASNSGVVNFPRALPQYNGVNLVDLSSAQTLTSKTLTSPTLVTPALGTPASGNLANCTFPTLNQSTTGNAATATTLQTARTINGVSFDGSANITVADSTKEPTITAGTTAQYWRGDKSWQTLNAAAVGLGNVSNVAAATTATASSVAQRDANKNLFADNFLASVTSTATAAGTTTLDIAATAIQEFTGTTTQTVKLPTTSILAGQAYTIVNNSTGAVTVQSSAGNTITVQAAGRVGVYTAMINTPTTDAHWVGTTLAAGKVFKATNDLTLSGTDGTTFTFPSATGTVLTADSTATLSNKNFTGAGNTWPTFNQSTTGSAATLTTGRTVQTNLASTAAATFNGSANITPGVTGTLPVGNGGTGATTLTGIVKGTGTTAMVAATAGTDYIAPGGALGTPSSGTLTNCTGLPLAGLAAAAYATAATASTLAQRDANGNLSADIFFPGFTTTATAAGTTTLTVNSTQYQEFTGTTTQTVVLPTTSIPAGAQFFVVNNSTGLVTVQSSALATITVIPPANEARFTALVAAPTTAAHWEETRTGAVAASGKVLTVSNSLTLAGTDGTTFTFPSTSGTVATTSNSLSAFVASTSNTIGVGTIELGHASDTTLSRSAAGVLAVEGVVVPTVSSADTLTNKRITPRIGTTASSATPSIDCGLYDQYNITALAAAITGVTVTGTPTDGQRLMVRIKDNATARAITWGASFVASGVAPLLATTVASKTHLCSFLYDAAAAKWVAVATDEAGY